MTKYLLLLLPLLVFASSIKIEHAQLKPFAKMIQTNAQITQLSNQKQEIVSRLSGHLESYFVKPGQHLKDGDKVVLIESIELSKMSAEYLSLSQQLKTAKIQKKSAMKLHQKGLSSQNDLNNAIIALEKIRSRQNTLASQLNSLDINHTELKTTTDQFILYAHADGIVGEILAPLHSNVNVETPIVTLVNQNVYYATAYLSVKDAMNISETSKGWVHIADQTYPSSFIQLLPNIDHETQRAKVLFKIENSPSNLLLGAYTKMDISLAPTQNVVMVKKSALTLFQGEWVVFTKKEHKDTIHHEESEHKEHHDEEEEIPYEIKVIKIISYAGEDVAVEGIEAGEEYVSDGVYFVKSMLLKSSLGGHGH